MAGLMARRPKTDPEGQAPAAVPPGVAAGGAVPAPAAAAPAEAPGEGTAAPGAADSLAGGVASGEAAGAARAAPAGRPAISVTGPAGGRWRAGRHFGPEPVVLAPDAIGPAAEAAIRADPRLVVAETVLPAG